MPILEACASSCPAMSAMSTPRRYCAMVASTSTLRFGPVKQRTHRIVDLLAERSEWGGGGRALHTPWNGEAQAVVSAHGCDSCALLTW